MKKITCILSASFLVVVSSKAQVSPAIDRPFQTPATINRTPVVNNQIKPTFNREVFALSKTTKEAFKPYTIAKFVPNAKVGDEGKMVTLPNGKKVALAKYVATINSLEQRLSDAGIGQSTTPKIAIVSKAVYNGQLSINPQAVIAQPVVLLSSTAMAARFNRINSGAMANLDKIGAVGPSKIRIDASTLPIIEISQEKGLPEQKFKVAGYGVTISGKQFQKGTIKPFNIEEAKRNTAGLNATAKTTDNNITIGFQANIKVALPGIGEVNAYDLKGEFTSNSNAQKKHHAIAKLTVLGTTVLDEDKDLTGDEVTYKKNKTYNTAKLLGSADFFTYTLNAIMPVDFYLNATGVGVDYDVDINRTGINGTITPMVSQSIYIETSLTEIIGGGPIGEGIGNTIDAGVGGEIRLIEGGISFSANMGLAMKSTELSLLNDVYQGFDLRLLKGRLYTFTQYPRFKCSNIFLQGLDLNCWDIYRQENDIFNTGSALTFKHKLADEDLSKKLNW
jgi:hypothetical protein